MAGKSGGCGLRRFRMTFERLNEDVLDSGGNPTPVWEPLISRWGTVRNRGGQEFFTGNQIHAETTHIIEGVLLDAVTKTITAKDRIKFRNRTLNILYATEELDSTPYKMMFVCAELLD